MAGHSQCTIYKNPVNCLAPFRAVVAQLVEQPSGIWKVMGLNLISEFIYVCFNYSFKHNQSHTASAVILDTYWDSSNQRMAGHSPCAIYKNPVNDLAPFRDLVAQSVEQLSGTVFRRALGIRIFSEFIYVCFNYSFKHDKIR